MDQQGNGHPSASVTQIPYVSSLYQPNPMAGVPNSGAQISQHPYAYQQIQHQQHQQLQGFWVNQYEEIEKVTDFKNHSLPLARIKKIMKADEEVRMISAEAPVIFARACEMFILELTLRSWNHTEENKRRTLQKNDVAAAITRTEIFDFLVDIVPREDVKDEALTSIPRGTIPGMGPGDAIPCYMPTPPPPPPPHPPQVGAPGMIMGKPVIDPSMYQQSHPYMAQPMWPHQGTDKQHSPPEN